MTDDEPFYAPGKKPTPPKHYRPTVVERLWELRKDHVTWTCDLRFMIFRDGEFTISQRFALKAVAALWAESEKADIEKGLK